MFRSSQTLSIVALAALIALACSDEQDGEGVPPSDDLPADVGYDADLHIPSVESIEFEGAAPSDRPRIHIESARKSGVISQQPPLDAAKYLAEDSVRTILGDADLQTSPLSGQGSSPSHNSIRYAPSGDDAELFGVGIQVWDLSEGDQSPDQRLGELRGQFLNVSDAGDGAPQGAFFSRRAGLRNFAFTAESDPLVFVLSCDVEHCSSWDELVELGAQIASEF